MDNLLSRTHPSAWERQSCANWMAEYDLLPIHYLRHLYLNINTWYISVEDEGSNININIINAIRFEMDHHTFDTP